MTAKHLYAQAEKNNISVFDWNCGEQKAATIEMGRKYAIFLNRKKIESTGEERCVLAHEIGHCKTGSTHPPYSPYDIIEKHERRADKFAIATLLPRKKLLSAMKKGNTELWQLADFFDLPQDFIEKAVKIYFL